uniref:Uncharacterized protein n=1 Tax=Anguilla anguilla TaxID=7936 RepID=A0A0E9SUN5_ANGAN
MVSYLSDHLPQGSAPGLDQLLCFEAGTGNRTFAKIGPDCLL